VAVQHAFNAWPEICFRGQVFKLRLAKYDLVDKSNFYNLTANNNAIAMAGIFGMRKLLSKAILTEKQQKNTQFIHTMQSKQRAWQTDQR
jgi:hypothetical protein